MVWPMLNCRQSRRDLLNWRRWMLIHIQAHHIGNIFQSAAPTTHACSLGIVSFQFSRDGALLGRKPASPHIGQDVVVHPGRSNPTTPRFEAAQSKRYEKDWPPIDHPQSLQSAKVHLMLNGNVARPHNTTCSLVSSLSRCLDRAPSIFAAAVDYLQPIALHSRRVASHHIASHD